MIKVRHKGDFSKITKYLVDVKKAVKPKDLDRYGRAGVEALMSATPVDTGLTAASWRYEVTINNESATITFLNSNIQNGVPIAVILQYGHGTGTGGYVVGRDYINPALRPIFDKIAKSAWEEVTKL